MRSLGCSFKMKRQQTLDARRLDYLSATASLYNGFKNVVSFHKNGCSICHPIKPDEKLK